MLVSGGVSAYAGSGSKMAGTDQSYWQHQVLRVHNDGTSRLKQKSIKLINHLSLMRRRSIDAVQGLTKGFASFFPAEVRPFFSVSSSLWQTSDEEGPLRRSKSKPESRRFEKKTQRQSRRELDEFLTAPLIGRSRSHSPARSFPNTKTRFDSECASPQEFERDGLRQNISSSELDGSSGLEYGGVARKRLESAIDEHAPHAHGNDLNTNLNSNAKLFQDEDHGRFLPHAPQPLQTLEQLARASAVSRPESTIPGPRYDEDEYDYDPRDHHDHQASHSNHRGHHYDDEFWMQRIPPFELESRQPPYSSLGSADRITRTEQYDDQAQSQGRGLYYSSGRDERGGGRHGDRDQQEGGGRRERRSNGEQQEAERRAERRERRERGARGDRREESRDRERGSDARRERGRGGERARARERDDALMYQVSHTLS
eukprot:14086-Rhodomonas_salina.1